MTRFRLLCLPALLACVGAAGAAESIPTPTYTDFMGSCSVAATEKGLKGAELGVMGLMCHCSFKKVQPQSRLTQEELMTAGKVCEEELRSNPKGFVEKYTAEVERELGPALK